MCFLYRKRFRGRKISVSDTLSIKRKLVSVWLDTAQRFAGHQRLSYAVTFRHFDAARSSYVLEHHAHLAVVNFLQNLADHRFEVNRHKNARDGRAAKAFHR